VTSFISNLDIENRNIGESWMTENSDYGTVKIPSDLISEIDKVIGKHGFKTRAEVVKEALRKYLLDYKEV